MMKHEMKEKHEKSSDEEMMREKKPRKPRAKKVRTEAEVKADKEKMAKLRALKGKK